MLARLLSIEVLFASDAASKVMAYFDQMEFRVVAVDGRGAKLLQNGSIMFILREAASEAEVKAVSERGTTTTDIAFVVEGMDLIAANVRRANSKFAGGEAQKICSTQSEGKRCIVVDSPVAGLKHTLVESCGATELPLSFPPGTWVPCSAGHTFEHLLFGTFSFVDHITIACGQGESNKLSEWYQHAFGLTNKSGATVLKSFGGGLRLSALWHKKEDEKQYQDMVKLTLVEPLSTDSRKSNQVTTFLRHHGGAGVQHVAFFCEDIFKASDALKARGIKFIKAPRQYYEAQVKQQQISSCGLDLEKVRDAELLFDSSPGRTYGNAGVQPAYLLQVFTEPSFERETMFFELIYRGSDSKGQQVKGFGAGNIRDLFVAVAMSKQGAGQTGALPASSTESPVPVPARDGRGGPLSSFSLYEELVREVEPIYAKNKCDRAEFFQDVCFRTEVAIVGGGLCGLTAALALARAGISTVIFEKTATLPSGTRAITWVPSTIQYWKALGVADEILSYASGWRKFVFLRGSEGVLFEASSPSATGDYFNVPQFVIHAVLLRHLSRSEHCKLVFSGKVVGLGDSLDREGMMVHVETAQKRPFSILAKFVLDCSGANSIWRTHILKDMIEADGSFLICDVQIRPALGARERGDAGAKGRADEVNDSGLPQERVFWVDPPFMTSDGTFLMLPQPGGVLRMDFSHARREDAVALVREALRSVRNHLPQYSEISESDFSIVWCTSYKYSLGLLRKAREGRLIWLGDSLKRVSPFGARGGNEGIRDVASLIWRLLQVLKHGAHHEILQDYETERLFSGRCNVEINRTTMCFIHPDKNLQGLRNAALNICRKGVTCFVNTGRFPFPPPSLSHCPEFKHMSEGMWDPGAIRPGDYFMDGPLVEDGQSQATLFDRVRDTASAGNFVALLLGEPHAEVTADSGSTLRVVSVARRELSQRLQLAYDVSDAPGIFLFRPDLVLMARWRDVSTSCVSIMRDPVQKTELLQLHGSSEVEWASTPRVVTEQSEAARNLVVSKFDYFFSCLHSIMKDISETEQRILLSQLLRKLYAHCPETIEQMAEALLLKLAEDRLTVDEFDNLIYG